MREFRETIIVDEVVLLEEGLEEVHELHDITVRGSVESAMILAGPSIRCRSLRLCPQLDLVDLAAVVAGERRQLHYHELDARADAAVILHN